MPGGAKQPPNRGKRGYARAPVTEPSIVQAIEQSDSEQCRHQSQGETGVAPLLIASAGCWTAPRRIFAACSAAAIALSLSVALLLSARRPPGADEGYNHTVARRLLLLSDAVYCRPADVARWDCPPCASVAEMSVSGIASEEEEAVLALVGWDEMLHAVVVAFRGTVLPVVAGPARYSTAPRYGWGIAAGTTPPTLENAAVRESSARRYDAIGAAVDTLIRETLNMRATTPINLTRSGNESASARVYLTGHSLGGAQALLAAGKIPQLFRSAIFEVYAFAPYRQSTSAWNVLVSAQPNVRALWRITSKFDDIPASLGLRYDRPTASHLQWSWVGLGQEVWYGGSEAGQGAPGVLAEGGTAGKYVICAPETDKNDAHNNDYSCGVGSVNPSLLNHADHDEYLGHMMWCCAESQGLFDWDFTAGPWGSPNPAWRQASGVGQDTRCDFPFGCEHCSCGRHDNSTGLSVPAAGCS